MNACCDIEDGGVKWIAGGGPLRKFVLVTQIDQGVLAVKRPLQAYCTGIRIRILPRPILPDDVSAAIACAGGLVCGGSRAGAEACAGAAAAAVPPAGRLPFGGSASHAPAGESSATTACGLS